MIFKYLSSYVLHNFMNYEQIAIQYEHVNFQPY